MTQNGAKMFHVKHKRPKTERLSYRPHGEKGNDMNTNYREIIGMPNLRTVFGVESIKALSIKKQKALKNIKYCSNDQWGFVNSWYDERSEEARNFLLDAEQVFNTIYDEGITNVYGEGYCSFNSAAQSYLKDIRFCGKKFLQTVALYYTAKLLEEAVVEVEGTESDAQRVAADLKAIKEKYAI